VTRAREAATAVKVAHATVVLTTETSAQEATVAQGSVAILIKDAEDRAALAKREALERVSGVEAERAMVLAST
jgi:hypothetical protein